MSEKTFDPASDPADPAAARAAGFPPETQVVPAVETREVPTTPEDLRAAQVQDREQALADAAAAGHNAEPSEVYDPAAAHAAAPAVVPVDEEVR